MTWDDIPPGVTLTDGVHTYIKMDQELSHLYFRDKQGIISGRGMHGDTPFGWSGDKGFFPVEYLY